MAITSQEFTLIRDFIEKNCGICVGDEKTYLIESRLNQFVVQHGCSSFYEFYNKVKADTTGVLKDKIIDAMTTNETLWFRDEKLWNVLAQTILPKLSESVTKGQRSKVRIWSAACSTGQEPYTLAMLIHHLSQTQPALKMNLNQFEIIATDISPNALFLAISGRYNQIEMSRGMPEQYKTKYFTAKGPIWCIDEKIKSCIHFKRFNLQDSFATLGNFDLILCRNVAIYFSDQFKRDFFIRMHKILAPTGYLILGSSESLLGHTQYFEPISNLQAIFYQPKNIPNEATYRR